MRCVRCEVKNLSLSTALFFLFFLSQTSSGFNTCEIHSHAITEKKKKKKRVSVVVSVSVVVLSSEESFSLLCRRFVSIDR